MTGPIGRNWLEPVVALAITALYLFFQPVRIRPIISADALSLKISVSEEEGEKHAFRKTATLLFLESGGA
jgi:hypothetical protein